ncbi:MAG TPA: hypothetical protein VF160_10070, partial [Candidatus Dormibacteraeota bacterium]
DQLSRWRGAGLLTPSQAEAIREYEKLRGGAGPAPAAAAAPAPAAAAPPPVPPPHSPPPPPPASQISRDISPKLAPAPTHIPGYLPTRRFPAVDGRVLGAILVALALLAMIGAVFALATDVVVAPSHRWATDFEDIAHAVAAALGLTGGLRMAGGRPDGRRLVLVSLGLNLAATVLFSAAHLAEATTFLPVLAWLVLAALTWYSRFPTTAVATRSQVG